MEKAENIVDDCIKDGIKNRRIKMSMINLFYVLIYILICDKIQVLTKK